MGRKIFVSYKYADDNVANLKLGESSTVRDYVTTFENLVDETDHIYKGESDGDDLSSLSDDAIWEKLKDRIYDSTLTIVFISPNMKESDLPDREQWIPWEVSYSLKETSRTNSAGQKVTSRTNAMLAVVLPDSRGSYEYYLEPKTCCSSLCTTHHTDKLFRILRENKFNKKNGAKRTCGNGDTVWSGECSYIAAVKWSDFKRDIDRYIDAAYTRLDNASSFEITKSVD